MPEQLVDEIVSGRGFREALIYGPIRARGGKVRWCEGLDGSGYGGPPPSRALIWA